MKRPKVIFGEFNFDFLKRFKQGINIGKMLQPAIIAFDKALVAYMQSLYRLHVRIRGVHDLAYRKSKVYKQISDSKYSRSIKRASIASFILSFVLLSALQLGWPEVFNFGTPNKALAGSSTKTWTTDADFSQGTASNAVVTNNSIKLSTQSNQWYNGIQGTILEGKQVYYQNLAGTYAYKTTNTSCNSPQCATGLDTFDLTKNSLVPSNAVDFSLYPARNACKAIGARLPYMDELQALYIARNTASYGNNFGSGYMLSATEVAAASNYGVLLSGSSNVTLSKNFAVSVRCVREPAYISPGTLSNLKFDAGVGKVVMWNNVTWNTDALPANTSVSVKIRTSNNDQDWSDWSSDFNQTSLGSTSGSGSIPSANKSRFIEVQITLATSDGLNTPTVNDVTLSYDSLESPQKAYMYLRSTSNVTLKMSDGQYMNGGSFDGSAYTGESSVRIQASSLTCTSCSSSTNIRPQIEVKPVGTAFDELGLSTATPGLNYSIVKGLEPGSYHVRIRAIDDQGRASAWTNYGATENENLADLVVEQSIPTGTVSINSGAQYATNKLVTLNVSASDTGGSNIGQMRFSNDGLTWSNWETYTTTKSNWDLSLYGGNSDEGSKTVYAQFKDNAGNQSGTWIQTLQEDFDTGSIKSNIASNASGNFALSQVTPPTGTVDNGNGTWTSTIYSDNDNGAVCHNISYGEYYVDNAQPSPVKGVVSDGDTICRNYQKFNLSEIDGNVSSAILNYTIYQYGDPILIDHIPDYGFRDETDYLMGPYTSSISTASGIGNKTADITTFVQNDMINSRTFTSYRYRLSNVTVDGQSYVSTSRDASPPYIVVTWEPTIAGSISPGTLISGVKDNTTAKNYGKINWGANVPTETGADALRFQVASNNDNSTWNYIGPDGTSGSYYTASGTQLHSSHNGHRYIRYKAYLQTANSSYTPTVYDVSIEVNTGISDTITLDSTLPTGTISINDNAQYALNKVVTLKIDPSDPGSNPSGIKDFQLSNDAVTWGTTTDANGSVTNSGTWGTWNESYRTTGFSWNLVRGGIDGGTDGDRTVYARYRDNADNVGGESFDPTWVDGTGAISGIQVKNADLSSKYAWKTSDTYCTEPQCVSHEFVDPQLNPSVDFTDYSAQNACKLIGGRLPTLTEITAISADQGRYGPFGLDYYLTAKESASFNFFVTGWYFPTNGSTNLAKTTPYSVRCVRDISFAAEPIADDVTLDTVAPGSLALTYNSGNSSTQNTTNFNVTFSATDAGSGLNAGNFDMEYQEANLSNNVPGTFGAWSEVGGDNGDTSPVTFTGTTGKAYKFRVAANDNAGQKSTYLTNTNWVGIDTTPPAASISYSSSMQSTTTINLSKITADSQSGVSDVDIEYKVVDMSNGTPGDFSGVSWQEIGTDGGDAGVTTFAATTGKAYKFRIRVLNGVGLYGSGSAEPGTLDAYFEPANWVVVDTTAPMATLSYESGFKNNGTINFTRSYADGQSGVNDLDLEYKEVNIVNNNPDFSGASWQDLGGNDGNDLAATSFSGTSGKAYMFRLRAKNNANLWGAGDSEPGTLNAYFEPANWIAIDTSAPTGSVSVNQGSAVNVLDIKLTLDLADAGGSNLSTYEISNDNSTWSTPVSITGLTYLNNDVDWTILEGEESKTIYVRLNDGINNTVTIQTTVTYDITAPLDFDITSPSDNLWQQSNAPTFGWVASLSNDVIRYELLVNNVVYKTVTTFTPGTPVATTPSINLQQGLHVWKVRAIDGAGNTTDSTSTRNIGYDSLAPSLLLNSNFTFSASSNVDGKVALSWPAYADISGNGSPTATYTIEKIKRSFVDTNNILTQNWSAIAGADYYQTTVNTNANYEFNIRRNPLDFPEDEANLALIDDAIPYTFRIKVTDQAGNVSTFLRSSNGMSYDAKAPDSPSNLARTIIGGFEIKLEWTPSLDTGVGVTGYKIYRKALTDSDIPADFTLVGYKDVETPGSPITTEYYDNDTNNQALYSDTIAGVLTQVKNQVSPRLNDYTDYFYRITAIDANGNESEVITLSDPESPPQFATNVNKVSAKTPDVTAPGVPGNLSVVAVGLDGQDDENDPKQRVDVSWTPATDSKATGRTPEGVGSGIKLYTLSYKKEGEGVYQTIPINDPNRDSYPVIRLDDTSNYEFKITATDNVDLISSDSDIVTIMTGSSAKPTTPLNVTVESTKGDPSNSNVGQKVKVSFIGSKIKDETNFIDGYQVYRATQNYTSPTDWLNPAKATLVQNITGLNIPGDTLDPGINTCPMLEKDSSSQEMVRSRCFEDTVSTDATRYYYKVRAIGNNPTIPDENTGDNLANTVISGFSLVTPGTINKGWDITPDVTEPTVSADALEVKVRDTHPNEFEMRNIITWKMLEGDNIPIRRKQSYETCTVVKTVSAIPYCSDFARYEIHREVLDPGTNEVLSDTNVHNETIMGNNYFIDIVPIALIDSKFKYYILIVDNAGTDFKYENNAVVNPSFSNVSEKQYWADTIIPSKSKPELMGSVTLSDVQVASAQVSWTTDQEADSIVQFRPKGSTGGWTIDGQVERTLSHNVKLNGLKPLTEYEYQIISRNYLGNNIENVGTLPNLTTSGFNITKGDVLVTTSTTEIKWTTNLDASSAFAEYQLQRQPGDDPQSGTAGVAVEELAKTPRSHTVVIKGLRSNRTYTYKIKSISSDGFVAETEFLTFRTKAFDKEQFTLAPSSSNVAERNITATTAQIIWQTAMETTSWVDYSTTSGIYDNSAGNNDLTNQHVVVIDGLVPGTIYYYRVRVKDANEVEYTSQEYSFKAVLKPKISNMKVTEVKPYSFTLEWDTNVETETLINFGTTAAYGEKKGVSGMSKVHRITVEGLSDNTEYHYQILAKDEAGNEVADDDKIIRTPLDTEGPQILNVKTDVLPIGAEEAGASVIISWQTNKPATTLVEYDEGIVGGRYGNRSVEDKSLNLSHSVILKDLKPASSYHFKIVSRDKRGNLGQSPDHTFVTPTKEKSILQLILRSLEETFSWTRNLGGFFSNVFGRAKGQ